MKIENFTLIEFLNQSPELIEKYMIAMRYLKPRETKREVFRMKLKHVELIKQTIDSGNDKDLITIVAKVEKVKEKAVLDMPIIQFFGIVNSIRKQLELIIRAEENSLSPSRIEPKWELVQGSEKMAKFGIYNTLDHLTGKKPHLYKVYMNMGYDEIFTILLKWKTESDLQHEMNQIKDK